MLDRVATKQNARARVRDGEAPYGTDDNVAHPRVHARLKSLPHGTVSTVLREAEDDHFELLLAGIV